MQKQQTASLPSPQLFLTPGTVSGKQGPHLFLACKSILFNPTGTWDKLHFD